MRRPGIVLCSAGLSLPAVAALALGIRFIVKDVPRMERDDAARVAAETENAAMRLAEGPDDVDFVWERGKGVVAGDAAWADAFPAGMTWREWDPESGTKRREMWGWREAESGRLVWARGAKMENTNLVFARVEPIEPSGLPRALAWAAAAFMALLAGTTVFGLKYFIGYVKTRDDFLAAAAHDLSTPLVAMRHMIGTDDAEALRLGERMLRLVANITDFLKLGRRPAPARKRFDLARTCTRAYALFRDDFRDLFGGDDVEIAVLGEGPVEAIGDETLAGQIAWNILGNDLKYAAPHGRVRVELSVCGREAVARFIDEGKGMDPKAMRKAFDRYWREKTVLESGKGGFGIGLCTAREFARAMGGSLTVRANSPSGCVFELRLPAAQAEDAENGEGKGGAEWRTGT